MKPIKITQYNENGNVRKISQAIFEIIKNDELLGIYISDAIETEIRKQIKIKIIQGVLTNSTPIDWKTLSEELKCVNINDIDEMMDILENEIISEMCKGHMLSDYIYLGKSEVGIEEKNQNSKKNWQYLVD